MKAAKRYTECSNTCLNSKIEASIEPSDKTSLRIELTILPAFSWDERYHGDSRRYQLAMMLSTVRNSSNSKIAYNAENLQSAKQPAVDNFLRLLCNATYRKQSNRRY